FAPDQGWQRRIIKDSGPGKHHDQIFGDFTGDGRIDLVFWNQHASALLLGTIPDDPHQTDPWPLQSIYHYEGIEHEGLAAADMDVDGVMDIVGGGRWFRHQNGKFEVHVIDDHQRFSRAAAGQLIAGGSPEVVFVCGDCIGPLRWYEWDGAAWRAHDLLDVPVDHGHSLQLADINDDGALDIFVAEMRLDEKNPDAATRILLGNGAGTFLETRVVTGNGYHESKVADLDGDGDLDILGKPYTWETPRLDIWLNQQQCTPATGSVTGPLANWQRHVIDASRPWRAFFIDAADLDGDGDADIVTGGWWYENPGIVAGTWSRHSFGDRLANMALLHDFDGDGAIDILGSSGTTTKANDRFAWAQNDGAGNFTLRDNIANGDGDFLQGVTLLSAEADQPTTIALSWHATNRPLQLLTVPTDPTVQEWSIQQLSLTTQSEALSAADIDRDGDTDL
ncbi:MAG: VCBS repeat-containing protein, partial [Caldilineaceae bacterium]|nr:VCBS repeat-containing protein [Caldilineaceae bacterium]